MKKKSLLTLFLAMLLAVSSMAACAPKQEEAPVPEEPAAEQAVPEQAAPEEQPAQSEPADSTEISADKAKEIALADAGVDAANAVFKKSELDFDDGVKKFEVEFFANDTEYSFDIDAASGAILSKEAEAMDAEDYQEMEALK